MEASSYIGAVNKLFSEGISNFLNKKQRISELD